MKHGSVHTFPKTFPGCQRKLIPSHVSVLHLIYIDEIARPDFAIVEVFDVLDYRAEEAPDQLLGPAERRLMSRCMGFLEVVITDTSSAAPWVP